MLYVLIGILACFAGWQFLRYRRLHRGVIELSDAVAERRQYLEQSGVLARRVRRWRDLTQSANSLIREVGELGREHAGKLDQLETTLGNLQEAVLVIDADNYVLLANDAFRRIFSVEREVVGLRIEGMIGNNEFVAFLESVRRGEEVSQQEIEFTRGDRTIWVEVSGSEIRPSAGEDTKWCLFVLHDITRLRRAEVIRKEFVANVSHELKTPLSVIKGYAETLVDEHNTMDPGDRDRFLQTMFRHSGRLAVIVDDLLTISRLESDALATEIEHRDLTRFLAGLREEFEQRLESTGHALSFCLPAGRLEARFDVLRMAQVFANLIGNAQKYSPPGSMIEIGAGVSDAEAKVWVRDNGPGIPEKDLPRIFERFYRVEKGRSREKGGTGLGLSIVKHIIQAHGGRTWVESTVGQGTKVLFTLPLVATERTEGDVLAIEDARAVAPGKQ